MKTNKFLQACIGISIVLFATAFLLRSINPAQAAPTPEKFITEGTDKIGKYQLCLNRGVDDFAWFAMIIDTETGKTVWYKSTAFKNGVWEKMTTQIPANPLGN